MPATRSSSRQQLRRNPTEISLSSSPETSTRPNAKRKNVAQLKPVPSGEVIEISSDDDEPSGLINPAVLDLRRHVKKLKDENVRYKADLSKFKQELSTAHKEILDLKKTSGQEKGKIVLVRLTFRLLTSSER
ncbi:hypothetical protein H0H81_010036 [Sphagnurus paluster]|uniref:Uncharacterized protein n=1 Tax=Sphagnurus paluster TaxID=117069 RepID=A0A9P7FUF9_9AGAR|nr:hypothetical protein H0H81_010036 [Sphagnurus paluster]